MDSAYRRPREGPATREGLTFSRHFADPPPSTAPIRPDARIRPKTSLDNLNHSTATLLQRLGITRGSYLA